MNPPWRPAQSLHRGNRKGFQIENQHWCRPRTSVLWVAESANDNNAVIGKRCGVEIRWRKRLARVSKDVDVSIRVLDYHVVVNEEIRIVVILMFAPDENNPAIRKLRGTLAESIETPAWSCIKWRWSIKVLASLVGT